MLFLSSRWVGIQNIHMTLSTKGIQELGFIPNWKDAFAVKCVASWFEHVQHQLIIVSPVRSMYGGYYGLVVVTPRPQTLHRLRGERIAGKQDGTDPIIYGPPRAPRIAKNAHFLILRPIYEKLVVIFVTLLYKGLLCDEVLLP